MEKWLRVGSEADLVTTLSVTVGDALVAVFRTDEGIFALDDICSHEYSKLSEGDVWAGEVYCQKHGSRFQPAHRGGHGIARDPAREDVGREGGEGRIWIAQRSEKPR